VNIAKLDRAGNDTIYTSGRNVQATTLTTGQAVALALHPASVSRGEQVFCVTAAAADLTRFHGVAAQDIASNAVGRVIVWGYCASVMISTSISDHTTIVPGEYLIPVLTLDGAFSSAVAPTIANAAGKMMWNMVTVNVSTNGPTGQSWTSGWLKGGL
jgi:hypothetical protein